MSSTPTSGNTSTNRTRVTLTITAVVIAVLVIAFFIISNLYTDVLWFDQLGYLNVLTTQWFASAIMFLVGFFGMAVPVTRPLRSTVAVSQSSCTSSSLWLM